MRYWPAVAQVISAATPTGSCYGDPTELPLKEDHPTVPTNPYGATKLAFEGALKWYSEAFGLKYVSLRYF